MKPLIISEAQYQEYRSEYIGLCTACRAERDCCEPDAEEYNCPECKMDQVYGIEQLLIMGLLEITDEGGES